ncbi:hypothetical protein RBB50_011387 [Rhinocladiella similis]
MAQRDNYTFENQDSIPAPLNKMLPDFFRSWDNTTSEDDTYLKTFAPHGELVFGPSPVKGREGVRALRSTMLHPENGPVVALEHTLHKCFVTAGGSVGKKLEVIVNGSIWYRLKNGRRIDADFASWGIFVDQGEGDYQAEFYEVYLDSYELTSAIKEMLGSVDQK